MFLPKRVLFKVESSFTFTTATSKQQQFYCPFAGGVQTKQRFIELI